MITPLHALSFEELHIKLKFHHIPIGHDVVFAFHAHAPGGFGFGHGACGNEVVEGDDFGFDESAFEVTVDYACCLWRSVALVDGSGAGFFGACGEVGLQSECGESGFG